MEELKHLYLSKVCKRSLTSVYVLRHQAKPSTPEALERGQQGNTRVTPPINHETRLDPLIPSLPKAPGSLIYTNTSSNNNNNTVIHSPHSLNSWCLKRSEAFKWNPPDSENNKRRRKITQWGIEPSASTSLRCRTSLTTTQPLELSAIGTLEVLEGFSHVRTAKLPLDGPARERPGAKGTIVLDNCIEIVWQSSPPWRR